MARPFRFNLETVLKVRKRLEDEHKRIVAARLRELDTVRRRGDHIRHQIEQETSAVRIGRGSGVVNVQDLARHRHWLTHLQKSQLDTLAQIRVIEGKLAQERSELARVSKKAKVIEKLKERRKNRHDREEDRRETRVRDEMAMLGYTRAAASGRATLPGSAHKRMGARLPTSRQEMR